jgi:hypothetical protein
MSVKISRRSGTALLRLQTVNKEQIWQGQDSIQTSKLTDISFYRYEVDP